MDSLKELREWFLADPENRWDAFVVADYYLTEYDAKPDLVEIPRSSLFAKPVVEAFAGDSLAYALWLRKLVRNYLVRGSEPAKHIGEVAKGVQSRGINRRKRFIEGEAVRWGLIKGYITSPKVDKKKYLDDKRRYLTRVRFLIKREYTTLLESHRRKTKTGRLSLEERDEIAAAFWDDLLQRYTSGDVPEA